MCLKSNALPIASATVLPVHAGVRKACQQLGKTSHQSFVKVRLRDFLNAHPLVLALLLASTAGPGMPPPNAARVHGCMCVHCATGMQPATSMA